MLNRRSINVLSKVSTYKLDNYFYVFNRKGQIILLLMVQLEDNTLTLSHTHHAHHDFL